MLRNIYHAGNERWAGPVAMTAGFAVLREADSPPELETCN